MTNDTTSRAVSAPTAAERQSIGDDAEFQELVGQVYYAGAYHESIEKSINALAKFLDTWAARSAAAGVREVLEKAAKLCDEMEQHYSDYKDAALLNGDVELSNAASGEPRACRFLAERIRALSIALLSAVPTEAETVVVNIATKQQ